MSSTQFYSFKQNQKAVGTYVISAALNRGARLQIFTLGINGKRTIKHTSLKPKLTGSFLFPWLLQKILKYT